MAPYDPQQHHRRSIRLREWDYTWAGAYFVTLVAHNRALLFDDVVLRRIVESFWRDIPRRFPDVYLDEWVVMSNHLHGIVILEKTQAAPLIEAEQRNQTPHLQAGSVGAVVGGFKSITARRINKIRSTPGAPVWQQNYWERVIRNAQELDVARRYIAENPARWVEDTENRGQA